MRIAWRISIATGAIALGLSTMPSASATRPPATFLCSFAPTTVVRDGDLTYFVGTALPDTVLAGLGHVKKPSSHGGHWGSGKKRAVYGQLVRADTLAGAGADRVRAAMARLRSRDLLLVPWDYDPGCEPTYWSPSARWVAPGLVGFYKVTLRAEKHWTDGRPTFDAFTADLEPYPHGPFFREGYRGTDAVRLRPSLSAREMFGLYEVLPIWAGQELNASALEPLERWAREHADLARKYPADEILATNRGRLRRVR